MTSAATFFGAAWADPPRTASSLRARALACGIDVAAASPVDLVAAVVGTQAWMAALRRTSLRDHHGVSAAAVRAAAALLARAAGAASEVSPGRDDLIIGREDGPAARVALLGDLVVGQRRTPVAPMALIAVQDAVCWAEEALGEPVGVLEAVLCACEDLAAGVDDPVVCGVLEAVLLHAEDLLGTD